MIDDLWPDWVMCGDEFSPVEIHDDGTADIVIGMCLITSLEDVKRRARRIYEIDDMFSDQPNLRLIWNSEDEHSRDSRNSPTD